MKKQDDRLNGLNTELMALDSTTRVVTTGNSENNKSEQHCTDKLKQ